MDEISPKFLKDGAEVLTKPICDIINLPIKLSTLPDKRKIANLIPLFKWGLKTDPKKLQANLTTSSFIKINRKSNTYSNAGILR